METSKETTGGSPPWEKDYLEHLRTVHFSLMIVSLALIVLVTSRDEGAARAAHRQVSEILEVSRSWNPYWVDEHVVNRLKQFRDLTHKPVPYESFAPDPPDANAVEFTSENGKPITQFMAFVGNNWILAPRDDVGVRIGIKGDLISWRYALDKWPHLSERPETLKQFVFLWNNLSRPLKIKVPETLATSFYTSAINKEIASKFKFVKRPRPYSRTFIKLELQWYEPRTIEQRKNDLHDFRFTEGYMAQLSETGRSAEMADIPVASYAAEVDFDGQSAFTNRFADWHHGKFEESFAALDEITRDYQPLDLASIEKILAGEEARNVASFEVWGVKFPARGTLIWGTLVMVGLQMYFWVHLAEFRSKLDGADPGAEIAWIGIYRSRFSRLIVIFSGIVMPMTAVALLLVRGWFTGGLSRKYSALLLLAGPISFLLAALTWRKLPRYRASRSANLRSEGT